MRVLLPKPVHGWRAFAGEVGVIVLGVLIALGAQEAVTSWNDRERAEAAKMAIRSEVALHDFNAAEIEITAPCIAKQAEDIQSRLVAGDPRPLTRYTDRWNKVGFTLRMPDREWSGTAWASIRDTDVLRQLEPEFARRIADHYGQVASQAVSSRTAVLEVNALNALSLMMPHDEAERLRLIQAAELVRSGADDLDLVAGQVRDRLARIGLQLPKAELDKQLQDSGTINFCRTHGYPLAKLRAVDPNSVDI